jgi:hypothetical protein
MTSEEINLEKNTTQDHIYNIHFTWSNGLSLPKRLSISQGEIYLNVVDCKGILQLPLYTTTMKHFFSDYKNYYYLPLEDMAIHKSVAAFVEPENRKKATSSNCYIRKEGTFLPCTKEQSGNLFLENYGDKQYYMELGDYEAALENEKKQYVLSMLHHTAL